MEIPMILKEQSKIDSDQNWHEPEYVEEALDQSLAKLQLKYGRKIFLCKELKLQQLTGNSLQVDLFLMHCEEISLIDQDARGH